MGFDRQSLNDVQLSAATSDSKRLLLLSGAGSGKTHTIISRIIYLLDEKKVDPASILALTFSNKAAGEIQDRVANEIPDIDTSSITVKTFHKLGSYILRKFGDRLSLDRSAFTIYDDDDSLELLKSIYPDKKKTDLKPIIQSILEAKDRGFGSEDYIKWRGAKEEYREYFKSYEEGLRNIGNVDFADLINLPIKLLSSDEFVKECIQDKFRYIFVDEYQDTNKTQFELLKLLVRDDTSLCVVGDDDQSIYSFRGADVDYILNFTDTFSQSNILTLDQNYRSSKKILSLANSLIRNNKSRHEKNLWTENAEGEIPKMMKFSSSQEEARYISDEIKEAKDYNNTAIIYRTNAQAREFETEFNARQIPYKVLKSNSFYDKEAIKDAIAYIIFAYNTKDLVSFSRIAAKPKKGIGEAALENIARESLASNVDIFQALRNIGGSSKAVEQMNEFEKNINNAKQSLDNGNKVEFFENLYKKTGFIEYYSTRDEKEGNVKENSHINAIKQFVAMIMNAEGGKDFMLLLLENITLRSSADIDDVEGVTLATMHAVKGLEFDNVYITGLEDDLIPSSRNSFDPKSVEEERRLLYVAITRARKKLTLSYTSRRFTNGHYGESFPSRFLRELDDKFYALKSKYNVQNFYTKNRISEFKPKQKFSHVFSTSEDIQKIQDDSFKKYKESLEQRRKNTKIASQSSKINSIYSIGDKVFYEKLALEGEVVSLRSLGGHKIVDINLSNGQKTSLVDTSKLIRKI